MKFWLTAFSFSLLGFFTKCDPLQCYSCEGPPQVCNYTKNIIECQDNGILTSSCYFQTYKTRISITATVTVTETKYVKGCGTKYEDYCAQLKASRATLTSCETNWCDQDLCNFSQEKTKTLSDEYEWYTSTATNLFSTTVSYWWMMVTIWCVLYY